MKSFPYEQLATLVDREPGIAHTGGWHAQLALQFAARQGRTYLSHRQHVGPLIVQRPFYPEGDVCHAYIVHPPGGVVGGDRLHVDVQCTPGSHALLTTPAATKFYRVADDQAQQVQRLSLHDATLEWLPQESIFFAGSRVRMQTRVQLDRTSRFIGWEIACYGRPASGESFAVGGVRQQFELFCDNAPLILDRLRVEAGPAMSAAWGFAGHPMIGTLLAYPSTRELVEETRTALAAHALASVTMIDNVLLCRTLGKSIPAVRRSLYIAWQTIRTRLLGRQAIAPRIWAT